MTDPIGSEPLRHPRGRRRFMVAVAGGLLAAPFAAEAQSAGKVYRIGFLRAGPPPRSYVEGFQQGLRARGYIDGQNVVIEYRSTDGSYEDLPYLARRSCAPQGRHHSGFRSAGSVCGREYDDEGADRLCWRLRSRRDRTGDELGASRG